MTNRNARSEDRSNAAAVLVTGAYGVGKTSVVEEIADLLERRAIRYGAIDLDWLGWFDPGFGDHGAGRPVMLQNLNAVVGNYYDTGVRYFALAGAASTIDEIAELREAVAMPLMVVRLTVEIEEIERRLGQSVTTGRLDDLQVASEWLARGRGQDVGDLVIANDGSIRDVAEQIVVALGW